MENKELIKKLQQFMEHFDNGVADDFIEFLNQQIDNE